MRMLKLPDGKIKILVQGLSKASMKEILQTTPIFWRKSRISKIPLSPKSPLRPKP